MAITVKHNKVSTIPDGDDTSVVRPSDWNADHTLVGLGTMAEQNANNVNITGGSITGVTGLGDVTGPASATDNAITRFDLTTGKLIQNSTITLDDNGNIINSNSLGLDTTPATVPTTVGTMSWDDGDGVPTVALKGGNVNLQVGTQEYARVFNDSGTTLTKGQAVYISGAQGNRVAVKLARADVEATSYGTIGLVAETMTSGAEGFIIVSGALYKLNTLGLTAGATVYLSPTTAGALTTTKPQAPDQLVVVGWVERVNATVGSIYVKVDNGYELDELHDVQITAPITTGQTLVYNGTTSVWQNSNAPTISGGTINNTTIGATTASTGRFSDLTDTGLTSGRVVYASTGGNLVDASNFTYDGTNLIAGAIQNTPIGATTPSSVNATTITGQTGVLRGTGSNLLLQSGWAGGTSGTVGSGAVAPTSWVFGASGGTVTYAAALSGSGNSIRFAATGADRPFIQQTLSLVAGLTYSTRFRVEAVNSGSPTLNQLFVTTATAGNTITYFVDGISVPASTVATTGTNVQIVTLVGTVSGSTTVRLGIGVNSALAGDLTLANPQIEIGSTANTYIPTTTTAVYGTPTLSFSGVSTIGLESNGSLFVSPAGTGALQAQATTSTTAGGNARGANAVDWQTSRSAATMVASGSQSTVGGGASNRATSTYGTASGGNNNNSSGFGSVIAGGNTNTSSSSYAFVGAGEGNTASNYTSAVVAGASNTSAGLFNFIGGGFTNSGTANAAVTTQSGTMNATTAVTLSGSNANIKVGQYITGTSIAGDTYVAAISGTSLTLSKNASGSSTSTLSFFTPHGVVVGGGNNQATGSYSFIGGGGDAGTAANRNVASGDWSFVGGGGRNTASGTGSVICGGGSFGSGFSANTASGVSAFIGAGYNNISAGFTGGILCGTNNTQNGNFSAVLGGASGATRAIVSNLVFPSGNPLNSTGGATQAAVLVLARQTTDATPTALASDGSAAGTGNQVIMPNNSAYFFRGEVISGVTGGGNTKGWTIEGVIKRGANAASTALVGTPTVTSTYADAGASAWVIAVTADTTNGGIRVTFTGQAATTIRTVCQIRTTEMTY